MDNIIAAIIQGSLGIVNAVIGAVIGAVVTKRIGDNRHRKEKELIQSSVVHIKREDENLFKEACAADKVCLYTVNSYKWANIFDNALGQVQGAYINEVIILVRKKDVETPEYVNSLNEVINIWRRLRAEGRIRKLSIYGYNRDPDIYYAIIGTSHVMTGHVFVDCRNPTSTQVDLQPIVITSEMNDGIEIIKKYNRHFRDMLEKYSQNIILIE